MGLWDGDELSECIQSSAAEDASDHEMPYDEKADPIREKPRGDDVSSRVMKSRIGRKTLRCAIPYAGSALPIQARPCKDKVLPICRRSRNISGNSGQDIPYENISDSSYARTCNRTKSPM